MFRRLGGTTNEQGICNTQGSSLWTSEAPIAEVHVVSQEGSLREQELPSGEPDGCIVADEARERQGISNVDVLWGV